MKIGIIVPNIWNSVFLEMAETFTYLEHKVVVFTDDKRSKNIKNFLHICDKGVDFFVINDKKRHPYVALFDRLFKMFFNERRFFTMLLSIYRFIKRNKDCDIFIVEWDQTGLFVAIINLFLPFRWIIGVHDLNNLKISITYWGRKNNFLIRHLKLWIYKQANLVRANSYVTRDFLVESGCSSDKIEVIPLHTTKWMRINEKLEDFKKHCRDEIFSKYNLPKETKLLITMCRLTPVKGLDLAIHSMSYILKQHKDAILMICGEDRIISGIGSYRKYLESLTRKLNIDRHIIFTGYIPITDVKKYLAASDLHLAPSIFDSFNYAMIESALVGTFSIASSTVGSAYWLLQEGVCEIIPCRDPIIWADSIIKRLDYVKQNKNKLIEKSAQISIRFHPIPIAQQILATIAKIL